MTFASLVTKIFKRKYETMEKNKCTILDQGKGMFATAIQNVANKKKDKFHH
jgi:hypothetical protein